MKKTILIISVLVGSLLLSTLPAGAAETPVLQTGELTIWSWHIHYSRHTFTVSNPGTAILRVTKTTPDKQINGGFLFMNRRFIALRHFLKGPDLTFEKRISLKSLNRLNVFMRGTPGAAVTIDILLEDAAQPPQVTSFSASPMAITLGEAATLTWQTENAENVIIDNGVGEVAVTGSLEVVPTETTTYTLTATGSGQTATAQATVTVNHLPPTVDLSASPDTIVVGDSVVLSWSSEWAESCVIEPDIGAVGLSGSLTVTPDQTTIYKIIASGQGGETSAEAIVTVTDPAPTVEILASAPTILVGESVDLTWTSQYADACTIEPGVGPVAPNGTVTVSPTETTTYIITATGTGGSTTAQVTVAVEYPVPAVTFSASPSAILLGQASTLDWSTTYADSVEIDQNVGAVNTTGTREVSPDQSTTYTLTATGPGGTSTAQVTVVVTYPMPTVDLQVAPDSIVLGQSATLTWSSTNALSLSIDNGIGTVPESGSLAVSPTADTTYTLTATGMGGQVATASVDLTAIPPAPVVTFGAQPDNISLGGTALLSWSTTNASTVSIEPGIGNVAVNGTHTVSPAQTTTFTLTASGVGGTTIDTVTVIVHQPPTVHLTSSAATIVQGESVNLSWSSTAADSCTIAPDVGQVPVSGNIDVTPAQDTTYTITASGPGGNATSSVSVVVRPPDAPPVVNLEPASITIVQGESATLSWSSVGAHAAHIDNGIGSVSTSGSTLVSPENTTIYTLTVTGSGGSTNAQAQVHVTAPTSPQPEGTFGEQYEDLIPADTTKPSYDKRRFAVITGKVLDAADNPLEGVLVAIHDHPEYGTVHTDIAGQFSIPLEGGGQMTVKCMKTGFLETHRKIDVPWNDIAIIEPFVMLERDTESTQIAFDGNPETVLTHKSTTIVDDDGTRSATIVFNGNTTAWLVDEKGNDVHPLDTIVVSATEYTTPESMPAELPPNSGFTYCTELSVEGADRVRFDKPVVTWVDNFIGFDVGTPAPVGYYDRDKGQWLPLENGVVVRLLDVDGDGVVDALDADGNGQPNDLDGDGQFGDEVQGLDDPDAYPPGNTYMRVALTHFTPCDINWPLTSPPDSIAPNGPGEPIEDQQPIDEDPCTNRTGSFAEVRSRVHHEDIPISGTDMTLHYASSRTPGYKHAFIVPASGDTVPDSLVRIVVRLIVAGRVLEQILPPLPNQTAELVWDGLDYRGQKVNGAYTAKLKVGFVYHAVFAYPGEFGISFAQNPRADEAIANARIPKIIFKSAKITGMTIGIDEYRAGSIAEGWTLSSHHQFYPFDDSFFLLKGDGSISKINSRLLLIKSIAGTGSYGYSGDGGPAVQAKIASPAGITVDESGNIYFADQSNNRVRKVDTFGIITTVAGNGDERFYGDGGPAVQASIADPRDVTFDDSGNMYIAATGNNRIRKVDPDGIVTTIAGNGTRGYSGDGGPAIHAQFFDPSSTTLDGFGNLYIADTGNDCIRKVDPNGIITTVVGNGTRGYSGDGGSAVQAQLSAPIGVAVDTYGNLYVADQLNYRVRKVDTAGIITTVAGNGTRGDSGDGGLAIESQLNAPTGVIVDDTGNLYIADQGNSRIRKVDTIGIINTVVGTGVAGDSGGGPAVEADLNAPWDIALDSVGRLYIADYINSRVQKVARPSQLFGDADASGDQVYAEVGGLGYVISEKGMHKSTIDLDTGVVLNAFEYDVDNLLSSVADQFGNQATIQRDGNGVPVSLMSPHGLITGLIIDADDQLKTVDYDDGSFYSLEYAHGHGLLTAKIEPNLTRFDHEFDANGRLLVASDQEGGNWEYTREFLENGDVRTNVRTAEGNLTTYLDSTDSTGGYISTITGPAGAQTLFERSSDGLTITKNLACGMDLTLNHSVDVEYGYDVVRQITESTPAGLVRNILRDKSYQDTDDDAINDLFTETTSVNGKTFTTIQNTLTSQKTISSPEGRTITIDYDPDTLARKQLNIPGLNGVFYGYDDRGRIESIIQNSRQAAITYDANGYMHTLTFNNQPPYIFTNDALGRVKQILRPDNTIVGFDYDDSGNLTLLTTPSTVSHVFHHDKVNHQDGYQAPLSGSYVYNYDRDRQLDDVTFPSQRVVDMSYSNARLDKIQMPSGTIDYAYQCGNKVDTVTMGAEVVDYDYDGKLVTSESFTGTLNQTVDYGYNDEFYVDSISYAGGMTNYLYDDDGLITDAGPYTFNNNPDNGLTEAFSDGIQAVSQSFNSFGEKDGQSYTVGGQDVFAWSWIPNDLGLIAQKAETIAGQTATYDYTYDDLGRLRTVTQDGVLVEDYGYDEYGTRDAEANSLRGIASRAFDYSDEDHLLSAGSVIYSYDLDGFLATKTDASQVTVYSYSLRGELLKVDLPDGTIIDYLHDPLGRRIAKRIDGVIVEKYLWQGLTRLLAVYDGSENLIQRFEYAGSLVPLTMTQAGVTYYLAYDQIGSLRVVSDSTGSTVKRIDYDSFGNIVNDTNPSFAVPLGFAGGLHDRDTGLVRFGYREYDPDTGRWAAKDPMGFAGGDSNLYGYVFNNPVNWFDPLGLKGMGFAYGGSVNLFGFRRSGHVEVRLIHDSSKSYFDFGAYEIGVTSTYGRVDDPCEGKGGGAEIDWGPDILFTNADHLSQLLGASEIDFGVSGGAVIGADLEVSTMLDADGNRTDIKEVSASIPGLPPPLSFNFGAEWHVGGKGQTTKIRRH